MLEAGYFLPKRPFFDNLGQVLFKLYFTTFLLFYVRYFEIGHVRDSMSKLQSVTASDPCSKPLQTIVYSL